MKLASLSHPVWLVVVAFLLTFWGWYNGFPFTYPDSGAYIFSGFEGTPPLDRPISYGLFIRHLSLRESLFWVMLAQGFLMAWFLREWLRRFLMRVSPVIFVGAALFLVSCTNASIYASFLLPDLFTPLFYGSLIVFLIVPLDKRAAIFTAIFCLVALVMHNSHLLGGVIFMVGCTAARLLFRRANLFSWKKIGGAWAIVAAGWLAVPTLHFSFHHRWTMFEASPIFTMARLHEIGILKPFLDEKCGQNPSSLKICAFKDSLPPDFLWNEKSPANKNGGWMANRAEFQAIVADILTTPRFLKRYAIESANATVRQFFYFRAEDTERLMENSPPFQAIQKYFPNELDPYRIAHQNHRRGYLDFEGLNARQQYLFFGALLLLVWLGSDAGFRQRVPMGLRRAFYLVFMSLVVNSFVCATFSTVVSRYEGRLVWLFILTGLMIFFKLSNVERRLTNVEVGRDS